MSAILEASHQIQQLFELNDPDRGVTVNVGTIDGGLRPNVVAPEVVADIDARAPRGGRPPARKAIRGLAPAGRGSRSRSGRVRATAAQAHGAKPGVVGGGPQGADDLGIPLEQAAVGGASDGNITSAHTATLDGLEPVGEGAHAEHEYVSLSQMPERAALLALLVGRRPDLTASDRCPRPSSPASPASRTSRAARPRRSPGRAVETGDYVLAEVLANGTVPFAIEARPAGWSRCCPAT